MTNEIDPNKIWCHFFVDIKNPKKPFVSKTRDSQQRSLNTSQKLIKEGN